MKLSKSIKKYLIPVCMVLAFALLLGLTLNLYKPIKRLTQKKVVNPDNLLNDVAINYYTYVTKDGITFERNKNGSWHIFGQSTVANTQSNLTSARFSLEPGKTYSLSSGMKHDSIGSYFLRLVDSKGFVYYGDLKPEYVGYSSNVIFGPFEAKSDVTYHLEIYIVNAGAVIDEVVYPCLVEGTEPGDFYIYK